MNPFDKFIRIFSPRTALRNHRARISLKYLEGPGYSARKYEGASKGKKTKNWKVSSATSANTELIPDLSTLRDRSRALVRDNGYAFAGIDHIESDTIGEGITPKFTHKNPKKSKECDEMFTDWAESTACDYDGNHDFYGLQSLVMRTVAESGECLIRRVWRDKSFCLQVLEPDFLDTSKNEKKGTTAIIAGIEIRNGQRVAYWLFDEHPGGNVTGKEKGESKRIDAKDIISVFRVDRSGQFRGVPWLAPCLLKMRDFDEYEDAELSRQKIAACFAGYITKEANEDDDEIDDEIELTQDIEPNTIQELGPGMDIKFTDPPQLNGLGEFSKVSLRGVAKGLGIPYELLAGDWSNVNYSSGKLGDGKYHRNIRKWRNKFFIPKFCSGVYSWFKEFAAVSGKDFSEVKCTWTHPRREPLDPLKENKAAVIEVEAGFTTISAVIRERGGDPEQVFLERAEELKKMRELGIPTSSADLLAQANTETPGE